MKVSLYMPGMHAASRAANAIGILRILQVVQTLKYEFFQVPVNIIVINFNFIIYVGQYPCLIILT